MHTCKNCGTQFPESELFCPNCGVERISGSQPVVTGQNPESRITGPDKAAKRLRRIAIVVVFIHVIWGIKMIGAGIPGYVLLVISIIMFVNALKGQPMMYPSGIVAIIAFIIFTITFIIHPADESLGMNLFIWVFTRGCFLVLALFAFIHDHALADIQRQSGL